MKTKPRFAVLCAVELLPPRLKLAIFWKVPARLKWETIRAVATCRSAQEVMAPAVADPAALGLSRLYCLMLDHVSFRAVSAVNV